MARKAKKTSSGKTPLAKATDEKDNALAPKITPQISRKTKNKQSPIVARHDDELERALMRGDEQSLLEDYFGPAGYAELQSLARDAAMRSRHGGDRVYIIPGIMGSTLGFERSSFLPNDVVWVDFIDIAAGNLSLLKYDGTPDRVKALGVILLAYMKMKLSLKIGGFDVTYHPFDWRLSLLDTGKILSERIEADPAEKIHLVCHSMGGLVARAALNINPQSEKVIRVIQLGSPNHGSFTPIEAIRGTHGIANKVAFIDVVHTPEQLSEMLYVKFPGLCELLPLPDRVEGPDYYDKNNWPTQGITPTTSLLRNSRATHSRLYPGDDRFTLIAGVNQETVAAAHVEDGKFVYTHTREGDGTVPLVAAKLDNVATYYVEESHGSLPNNSSVISAVDDILNNGRTNQLPDTWQPERSRWTRTVSEDQLHKPALPGEAGRALGSQEQRDFLEEFAAPLRADKTQPASPPAKGSSSLTPHTAPPLNLDGMVIARRKQHRLNITLALGSITEVDSRACVVGLFNEVPPGGAARAIDNLLGNTINELVMRRMFNGRVGEVSMFPTARQTLRAELVAFAGLGAVDQFERTVLETVGENIARTFVATKVEEFATVLLGAGTGINPSQALESAITGFLKGIQDADYNHRFRGITICEIDPEKFQSMKGELVRLASTPLFDDFEITFDEVTLPSTTNIATRSSRSMPQSESIFLMVNQDSVDKKKETRNSDDQFVQSAAVLTTGSAAVIFKEQIIVDSDDLDKHLEQLGKISPTNIGAMEKFGTELAQKVLPQGILEILGHESDQPITIIHDIASSRIPWETIYVGDTAPSLVTGISRRPVAQNLSVAKWRAERQLTTGLDILLVVDPTLDLSGARAEGDKLEKLFARGRAVNITRIDGIDAKRAHLLELFGSGEFDVIHYAGHAFFDPVERARSGIICNGGDVLSGHDLAGIGNLPSLMFFNACEAGRMRKSVKKEDSSQFSPTASRLKMPHRIDRNVGFAEAAIRGGVANYVGTYWPVGDRAAEQFSQTFYSELLEGETIGKALRIARQALYDNKSIDWADYIHYGNADFVLKMK